MAQEVNHKVMAVRIDQESVVKGVLIVERRGVLLLNWFLEMGLGHI